MTRDDVLNEYFEWLYNLVCEGRYSHNLSYHKLLMYLHNTEFVYSIKKDENRAADGVDLHYRFATWFEKNDRYILKCLDRPCSVLEMMVALAIRCEETIMDDPLIGNRTGQWFWGMITNLGLGSMIDSRFDEEKVKYIVDQFLNRDYSPNGKGGLFTVRNCDCDMRKIEIWTQMLYYLDSIM